LDNYIFKIIPVLNPDGVARGQWRFDTQGANLNRKYLNPSEKKHPSIKAAKEAVLKEYQNGNMKLFIDFHAHSTKRGCFIYGNSMSSHD
jgi:murein tripeptide amidase MpaA